MKVSLNVIVLLATIGLSSCGIERNQNPFTGNGDAEVMLGNFTSREEVKVDSTYAVTSRTLNVRPCDNSTCAPLGYLSRYDKVKVVGNGPELNSSYVQIEIVKSWNNIKEADQYFVSYKYLGKEVEDHKEFTGEYFVVQNIATERARVYKRGCETGACDHELVLETQVAMGEDSAGERTWAGSYRITDWVKFYQDGKKHYPSWYDPRYPAVPKPGKGFTSWLRKKYMPEVNGDKIGVMRGAFGWYAALVGPNHNDQWSHGTIGWGEDKDKFILKTKRLLPNIFTSPRSHGCTRHNNEAIAWMNAHLPVGTPIIKIYAIEGLANSEQEEKERGSWNYIMTKDGVRASGAAATNADKDDVLARITDMELIIEQGTFEFDRTPDVIEYTPGEDTSGFRRSLGSSGNIYGIPSDKMKGIFYIDTGRLSGYDHPEYYRVEDDKHIRIPVIGGFKDEVVPSWMALEAE